MRKSALLLVLLLVLSSVSCWVPSLQPLYEDGQPIFGQALLGTWGATNCDQDSEGQFQNCTIALSEYDDKRGTDKVINRGYNIVFRLSDGTQSTHRAYLVQLAQYRFLDSALDETPLKVTEATAVHLLPVHMFWKITVDREILKLYRMRSSWFNGFKGRRKIGMHPVITDEDWLLTAQPRELQAFFKKHADDLDFFEDPIVWQKQ